MSRTVQTRTSGSRQKLLISAVACFLKSGYSATSLDDIAAESELSKQTIYNHFQTKETLFRASIDYLMQQVVLKLEQEKLLLQPFEFFYEIGQLNLTLLQSRKLTDLLQLAVKESRDFPELQQIYSSTIIDPIIAFIGTYIESKMFQSKHQSILLAWAFRSAITGYATLFNTNKLQVKRHPDPQTFLVELSNIFVAVIEKDVDSSNHQSLINSDGFKFTEDSLFSNCGGDFPPNQIAIIKASLQIFAQKGYLETTMVHVAKEARVAKQTVYNNFKSKEALYKTFCQVYLKQLTAVRLKDDPRADSAFDSALRNARVLFALSSTGWFLNLFRTMISESYFFPGEANDALTFLFAQNDEFGESMDEKFASRLVTVHSISGYFVLSRKIYRLSGDLELKEDEIFDLLCRIAKGT